jgi:hypothetical protein
VGGVDWERQRIRVRSPKTDHEGKDSRMVSLFPDLRPYLPEVFERAEPGTECVSSILTAVAALSLNSPPIRTHPFTPGKYVSDDIGNAA